MAGVRWLVAILFAIGIVTSIGDFRVLYGASALALDLAWTGTPDVVAVESLDSLHVRGDVRVGDRLAIGSNIAYRFAAFAYPQRSTFVDRRTNRRIVLSDVPGGRPFAFTFAKFIRLLIECTALGLLIARGSQRGVLALCTFLFLDLYTEAAFSGFWLGPIGAIAYEAVQQPLEAVSRAALVLFAVGFIPDNRAARVLSIFAYAVTGGLFAFEIASDVASAGTGAQWDFQGSFAHDALAFVSLLSLTIFALAARNAAGSERRRILILGLATVIGSSISLYAIFGGPTYYNDFQAKLAGAAVLIMTAGLVYGIVVEHLFDIAFVVNRAFVYAVTSAFVVLAFVAIEWLVGRTAASFGHVQGAAVELGLAIVVALSLRPIHARVDALVDSAIFAARHRSAKALLRFAEDCAEFHASQTLLEATLSTLRMYGRVSASAIFLADESGDLIAACADGISVTELACDDPAVVRMRTSRAAVERGSYGHMTIADVAFPMLRRRVLIGAICCSLPSRAEPYSPEEFDALAAVAREVGGSLVALEAAAAQRLAGEVAELRAQLTVERGLGGVAVSPT